MQIFHFPKPNIFNLLFVFFLFVFYTLPLFNLLKAVKVRGISKKWFCKAKIEDEITFVLKCSYCPRQSVWVGRGGEEANSFQLVLPLSHSFSFYRTRIRSLLVLLTHWLMTDSLTNVVETWMMILQNVIFLAVQDSSICDLVTHSVSHSVRLLISVTSEHQCTIG